LQNATPPIRGPQQPGRTATQRSGNGADRIIRSDDAAAAVDI